MGIKSVAVMLQDNGDVVLLTHQITATLLHTL